jgi:hypothetical protein
VINLGLHTKSADEGRSLQPFTVRILARLPGLDAVWIGVWALVPWLNAGANLLLGADRTSAVWEQSTPLIVLNYAALTFASGFTMWASGRLVREVEALGATTPASRKEGLPVLFRGMNSVSGPLLASAGTAIVFAVSTLLQESLLAAAVRGATWCVIGIAMWTFLWTYVSLLLGPESAWA